MGPPSQESVVQGLGLAAVWGGSLRAWSFSWCRAYSLGCFGPSALGLVGNEGFGFRAGYQRLFALFEPC